MRIRCLMAPVAWPLREPTTAGAEHSSLQTMGAAIASSNVAADVDGIRVDISPMLQDALQRGPQMVVRSFITNSDDELRFVMRSLVFVLETSKSRSSPGRTMRPTLTLTGSLCWNHYATVLPNLDA